MTFVRAKILAACFALFVPAAFLAGIQYQKSPWFFSRPPFQVEAASPQMSLVVRPWSEFEGHLKSRLVLSDEDLFAMAVPTTASIASAARDIAALRLSAGLSTDTRAIERLTSSERSRQISREVRPVSEGVATSSSAVTETVTETSGPGEAPPTPTLPPPAETQFGQQPSLPGGGIGEDLALRLDAYRTLRLKFQVPNRMIEVAAKRQGYDAYFGWLTLSINAKQRALPYDVYNHISFGLLEADGEVSERRVLAIPILANASLERASVAHTVEVIRQLGLALSGIVGGVGVGADFTKALQNLDQFAGRDLNSVLSVSRGNDNALEVRMGARRVGNDEYQLVSQSHDIGFLMLVEKGTGDASAGAVSLQAAARQTLVDGNTGRELVAAQTEEIADSIRRVAQNSKLRISLDGKNIKCKDGNKASDHLQKNIFNDLYDQLKDESDTEKAVVVLRRRILDLDQSYDWPNFLAAVRCLTGRKSEALGLSNALKPLIAGLPHKVTTVRLPKIARPAIPQPPPPGSPVEAQLQFDMFKDQLVIVGDSGKNVTADFVLTTEEPLTGSMATLKVEAGGNSVILLSDSFTRKGKNVRFLFPSLATVNGMQDFKPEQLVLRLDGKEVSFTTTKRRLLKEKQKKRF